MPANWATLPDRWECKAWHAYHVRCRRCQTREQVYGDRRASRHGGLKSTANCRLQRGFWRETARGDAEFREHHRLAVDGMLQVLQRDALQALAINGPREWVAIRCWMRASESRSIVESLLATAKAFAWERQGPDWGRIAGGVAHTDSGLLSAVSRQWIVRAGLEQAVTYPRSTYARLRRMVPLLLEPAQPWLVRYSWRAAREWGRLRVKRLKLEAAAREAQIAAIRAAEQKSLEQPPP